NSSTQAGVLKGGVVLGSHCNSGSIQVVVLNRSILYISKGAAKTFAATKEEIPTATLSNALPGANGMLIICPVDNKFNRSSPGINCSLSRCENTFVSPSYASIIILPI